MCEARGDLPAERYRARRPPRDRAGAEWDGEWYRRGYYDDGTPLGAQRRTTSARSTRSPSPGQSSRGGSRRFADRAMDAVRTHLVRRGPQVLLLLTPPFDRSAQDPGYIKGYPPGVRENGGQYTHAAVGS